MKKLAALILFLIPVICIAQSVAINTDAALPHQSAILDIKSDTKGLLTPRLTTLQRTSIPGPAIGLTVFDMDTFSYWIYRGDLNGGWAELQHSLQNLWQKTGNNIFNTNIGNVGFGPYSNFDAELKLNGAAPRFAFMQNDVAKGFIRALSDDFKFGTYPGNSGQIIFSPKNVDKIWIDQTGFMGIGTSTPSSELTINGSNPYLQLRNNEVNTGFLQLVGSHVKLGTNSTNLTGNLFFQTKLTDRMMIDENGLIGIGTSTPSSILTINSSNPILQLRNNNVDKGFVQIVNDDIKIGTNQANTNGNVILRTKGVDRFTIDKDGIGTFGDGNSGGMIFMNSPVQSGLALQYGNLTQGFVAATSDGLELFRNNPGNVNVLVGGMGMRIRHTGQVCIGINGASANGYTFCVEGKAIATEFKVLAVNSWPDYVFDRNYKLRPLSEVKNFINQNKHLPDIPSAAVIEKEGISLGDMSKRLMEKVEELTLYVLQLQDQIDELKKQLSAKSEK